MPHRAGAFEAARLVGRGDRGHVAADSGRLVRYRHVGDVHRNRLRSRRQTFQPARQAPFFE